MRRIAFHTPRPAFAAPAVKCVRLSRSPQLPGHREPLPLDSRPAANESIWGHFWSLRRDYLDDLSRCPHMRWLRSTSIRVSDIKPGMTVIDGGCGLGIYTKDALQKGAQVIAIEFSGALMEVAQKRIQTECSDAEHARVQWRTDDMAIELPKIPDHSIDIVHLGLVLCYLRTPAEYLAHIHRILKPGGRLVMTNPPRIVSPFESIPVHLWNFLTNPGLFFTFTDHGWAITEIAARVKRGVFNFFTNRQTKEILKTAGFSAENIKISYLWGRTARLAVAKKDNAPIIAKPQRPSPVDEASALDQFTKTMTVVQSKIDDAIHAAAVVRAFVSSNPDHRSPAIAPLRLHLEQEYAKKGRPYVRIWDDPEDPERVTTVVMELVQENLDHCTDLIGKHHSALEMYAAIAKKSAKSSWAGRPSDYLSGLETIWKEMEAAVSALQRYAQLIAAAGR